MMIQREARPDSRGSRSHFAPTLRALWPGTAKLPIMLNDSLTSARSSRSRLVVSR